MNKQNLFISLIVAGLAVSCSGKPEIQKAVVKGNLAVSDSLGSDEAIGVTIVDRDTSENEPDTVLHMSLNENGDFEGIAEFPETKYYRLGVSRNGKLLGSIGAILSDNDTLFIQGELGNLKNTLTLKSREHDAMNTFNRVDKSFERVAAFIRGGAVPDSQLIDELKKWSDLYWDIHQKHSNTMAAQLAAEQSASLLSGWNDSKMLSRIDEALPGDYMVTVAMELGKPYIESTKGFSAATSYMDSLTQLTDNKFLKEMITREKIRMHFDSAKVREAKSLIDRYEKDFADNEASQEWAKSIRYDVNYLAPGVKTPDFSFVTTDGDSISNALLTGDVYILEVTPLASVEYQNDLDRTVVIHEIYKNYGLKIFTIPLDQSEITVDAFFEERRKVWPVAKLGTFDVQQIIEKFNITQVPTRLLIDKDGVLIRKYVRNEFSDVIQGLNKAFRSESPS